MPLNCRHKQGITLPEVLISMAIMSLVLVGAYSLIVFSMRWNAKMSDSVATYQQAFRASNRLSYDLGTGSQLSFIYNLNSSDNVDGFAFASARPSNGRFQLDPSGRLLWHRYILYYVEGEALIRNEVPIDPPLSALPDTPELPILKTQTTGPGATLVDKVSELEILDLGSGASVILKVSGEQTERDSVTGEQTATNSVTLQSRLTFRQ